MPSWRRISSISALHAGEAQVLAPGIPRLDESGPIRDLRRHILRFFQAEQLLGRAAARQQRHPPWVADALDEQRALLALNLARRAAV